MSGDNLPVGTQQLEMRLTETRQRLNVLLGGQRRSDTNDLTARIMSELALALELLRQAHARLVGTREQLEQLQRDMSTQQARYADLLSDAGAPASQPGLAPPRSISR